tara:strand:- start:49 stop:540 length:492 start_codon:yes stop_codon:yes gene_type:complete
MIDKVHYTWKDIEHMIQSINNLMFSDQWRPDYVVGLTRGGLVPSTMLSNMTGITMHTLDVRFRDTDKSYLGPESNGTMKKDAMIGKNILIFDDINDTGRTFNWIKEDWNTNDAWGKNVRTAALVDNGASEFGEVDYTAIEINKAEKDVWVVFPWEGERHYGNI